MATKARRCRRWWRHWGIASARIYAAFGSKEQLFREAVALYEASDGGFADRALREQAVRPAIERMLHDAVLTYTKRGRAQGCLVVSAAPVPHRRTRR